MPGNKTENRLSSFKKFQIIQKILTGDTVNEVAKSNHISKTSIYKWLKKFNQSPKNTKDICLENLYISGYKHKKKIDKITEKKIIKTAIKFPNLSAKKLAKKLYKISKEKIKVSTNGVHLILKSKGLSRREGREEYKKLHGNSLIDLTNRSEKEKMISLYEAGESISSICKRFKISRPTFYKWYKRWKETSSKKRREALLDKRPKGEEHWRFIPEARKLVLDKILEMPEGKLEDIVAALPLGKNGKPILGRTGVYKMLSERGLGTVIARREWVRRQIEATGIPAVRPEVSWKERPKLAAGEFLPTLAPAPPPLSIFQRVGFFLTSLQRYASNTFFFILLFIVLFGWGYLLGSSKGIPQSYGYFFASLALFMGTIFFLYSLKYYFSLALVLSFSVQKTEGNVSDDTEQSKGGLLARLFALSRQTILRGEKDRDGRAQILKSSASSASGLNPDISGIKLERYPFISVHLPMYNERRVAERILRSCTLFEYPNYEIVVADDSNNEAKDIVKNFITDWNKKRKDDQPRIKLIHRDNREGFKGGALKEALKATDKRAEFIVVFDADFVPYPDTLELFVKYFQSAAGSLDFRKVDQEQEKALGTRHLGFREENSNAYTLDPKTCPIAAIQGYQWHVLNKSENWITRGVRSEYAGSYVVERSGAELYQGLKQIAGSVYMVRRDLLDNFGWGSSITEDFQLTLRLYEQGYKVIYTPYIQAPSECVSTLKRLIRQRMRWAEGHSHNVRLMFRRLISNPRLKTAEKLEFLYLSPYYLQAAFFLIGTLSWLFSEAIFRVRLPFWTSVWGWSLVLTNLLSLPLMNMVGLFLEESEERDFMGILSFVLLTYLLVPFQAYASVKGFIEKKEGPWFRTPKTGRITDIFRRGRLYRFIQGMLPSRDTVTVSRKAFNPILAWQTANNQFNSFRIRPRRIRWLGKVLVVFLLISSMIVGSFGLSVPIVQASPGTQIKTVEFYIYQYNSSTDITSGNGICDTAGGCSYDSLCSGSGVSFTIDLPENSVTVRRAIIEWRTHEDNTAATISSGEMKFCRTGQTARTQSIGSMQVSNTGENDELVFRMEAQDTGASNGGQIISGSNTYKFDAQLTGNVRNTDSVRIIITYEYDDTSATQLKTVRYLLFESLAAQQAIGTNTDTVFNPQITEGGVTILQNWIEMSGEFGVATNTYLQASASLAAGTSTCSASSGGGYLDGAADSNRGFFIMQNFSTTPSLNADNCIRYTNSAVALNDKYAEYFITFKYSYGSGSEADDTTHIKTVNYFLGNQQTDINSSFEEIGTQAINLPENSISFKSAWIRYYTSIDAADTFTGCLAVGDPATACTGATNDQSAAVALANGGQETGFFRVTHDVTSFLTSNWSNGSTFEVSADAAAATNIWGTTAELLITYSYNAATSSTGIKTVFWWVGSRSARGTGDFTDSTETASTAMGIPFTTYIPEGSATKRDAGMIAVVNVAAAPTSSSTNSITRGTDTASVNYLASAAENFTREHGVDLATLTNTAQSDLSFTITGAGSVNELESAIAYTTYETTVPLAPEKGIYVLPFAIALPMVLRNFVLRRRDA